MSITRRSFLAGLGSVSVGLLFRRQLDRVLDSLERDSAAELPELTDEPQAPEQQPSAAEIVVMTQTTFRPERLVVPIAIAPLFVIEDIQMGGKAQLAMTGAPLSAEMFTGHPSTGLALDTAMPGMEIRFRVRYVGKDPKGLRFQAALIGRSVDGRGKLVLPIDSGCEIVA